MPKKITCQRCGTSFTVPDELVDALWNCANCGAEVQVGATRTKAGSVPVPASANRRSTDRRSADRRSRTRSVRSAPSAVAPSASPAPPSSPQPPATVEPVAQFRPWSDSRIIKTLVTWGFVILVIVCAGYAVLNWWSSSKVQTLHTLFAEASRAEGAGHWTEAAAKYDQAVEWAQRHSLDRGPLRDEVAMARAGRSVARAKIAEAAALDAQRAAIADSAPSADLQTGAAAPDDQPATAPAIAATQQVKPLRQPMNPPKGLLTDDMIDQAIRRGVAFLWPRVEAAGVGIGDRALMTYALLQCSQTIDDQDLKITSPRVMNLIDKLKHVDLTNYRWENYVRSVRALALSLYNRPVDRACLSEDVHWLLAATRDGGYTYQSQPGPGAWDNSNSQYGVLGVWAGADAGIQIPVDYWLRVQNHWTSSQNPDGRWSYQKEGQSSMTMTLAGIASLLIAQDYLETSPGFAGEPYAPELARALDWLEQDDHVVQLPGRWSYALYGIERVGLASGYKFIGGHDWYREFTTGLLLPHQNEFGAWDSPEDTSFALLFLARDRHPILLNKLYFPGAWANHPRDAANLARYAGHTLERPLNWQVVRLQSQWAEWTDSPILYLASDAAPPFTDADVDKIRNFVQAGGLLLTQADGASPVFNKFAADLARRLFPAYPLKPALPTDELYSLVYHVDPKLPVMVVNNGSRLLMVHFPTDVSVSWQPNAEKIEDASSLAMNILIYATGKSDLRNRLAVDFQSPLPPEAQSIDIARLRYDGPWDPEPAAWQQFGRWFQRQTSTALRVSDVDVDSLDPAAAPVAHLTGNATFLLTPRQRQNLRRFVHHGGTLLIDPCGGSPAFNASVQSEILAGAFSDCQPHPLSDIWLADSSPCMDDLAKLSPRLRPCTITKLGPASGTLSELDLGKGRVIVSDLDLTSGLLGARTWGILGYQPAYARSLVKNVILWTVDGAGQ